MSTERESLAPARYQSVVAGQVWKRPGVYATVTHLRDDPLHPLDEPRGRTLATLVEVGLEDGWIQKRELSCDELRAEHVLVFDATLKEPFDVR